jgi:hypothetical protein
MNSLQSVAGHIKYIGVTTISAALLLMAACQPAIPRLSVTITAVPVAPLVSTATPVPTITPKPTVLPTTESTATPTKIPTPTDTFTPIPTLRPFEDWTTVFWPNCAVTYNTLEWTAYLTQTVRNATTEIAHTLESRQVPTCQIQEMGATEIGEYGGPVPASKQVTLKKITYTVFRFDGSDKAIAWYLIKDGLKDYPDGLPTYIVSSRHIYWQKCEAQARRVLETAHTTN